jgi:parvulin-like peptidyl-prolyl isomerase
MAIIVNGERVEDQEIQQEVERLRPSYEQAFAQMDPAAREAQLLDWSKENVVERVLLRHEARSNGQEVPTEEVDAAFKQLSEQYEKPEALRKEFNVDSDEKVREMIELQMKVERKINEIYAAAPEPGEAEIQAYYDENKERFKSEEQIRVAHIVRYVNWQTDEATALETIKQAQAEIRGGSAFEAVVDQYTDCADSGGDLGYVAKGQMVEEFEDVVFNLNVGQVSDVFRTRFGFHIAKVYDRKPPAVPELNDVKKQIAEQLQGQKKEQALGDYLDQLRSRAAVEEA